MRTLAVRPVGGVVRKPPDMRRVRYPTVTANHMTYVIQQRTVMAREAL
jgi:hypothetical protein